MALDGCGVVCKYVLIIFNIIFALVGMAFLGFGLWLRFSGNTRGIFSVADLNSSTFVIGVTVLITLGSVMLIMVMFGDYGACNEKRCALQVFTTLVAMLAAGEVVIGVLVYSKSDKVAQNVGEFYASLYSLYVSSGDPAIAVSLTFIHNALHCCGLTGISLVEMVQETCPKPDGFLEKIKMPSCPGTISSVFDSKAPLVMGMFLGTGALLILALICSTILSAKIRLSASSPQYIVLTHTSALAPPQHDFVSPSYPGQDPVLFTPLSVVSTPVPQV
ncbi:CD9 antigen [Xenentodon cancila]